LNRVENRFRASDIDESRALFLWLRANYNTKKAISFLQPHLAMQAMANDKNGKNRSTEREVRDQETPEQCNTESAKRASDRQARGRTKPMTSVPLFAPVFSIYRFVSFLSPRTNPERSSIASFVSMAAP
jgi:hypothetical protein